MVEPTFANVRQSEIGFHTPDCTPAPGLARAARAYALRFRHRGVDRALRHLFPPSGSRRKPFRAIVPYGRSGRLAIDSNHFVGWHIFFYGTYRPEALNGIRDNLGRGSVAVDVGASIGDTTVQMASTVGPTGRVFSFEPHPGEYRRLLENVVLNNFSHVNCMQAAAGDSDGQARLIWTEDENQSNGYVRGPAGREHRRTESVCSVVRLDTVLPDTRVDFIKIDSQGSDLAVLKGARHILTRWHPTLLLNSVEREHYRRAGFDVTQMCDYLRQLGYSNHTWLRPLAARGAAVLLASPGPTVSSARGDVGSTCFQPSPGGAE